MLLSARFSAATIRLHIGRVVDLGRVTKRWDDGASFLVKSLEKLLNKSSLDNRDIQLIEK